MQARRPLLTLVLALATDAPVFRQSLTLRGLSALPVTF